MNLFDELKWRGLVYDATDGLADAFAKERVTAYIGFDPTASSLHIGNLLGLVTLSRLQRYGHSPIAIAGGGTGMIGDPSGKSQERTLLTLDQINANLEGIKPQLAQFLDFDRPDNPARVVNNADWLATFDLLGFPARHRQVLHRELHAAEGIGEPSARERGRHLVHRVQLPAAAGARLSRAVRSLRLHAADGRQRSVGQHHRRHRADSQGARDEGARPGHAAGDHRIGREVREDRSGHDLARSRADAAERVPEVLAEHRRSRRDRVSEVLHVSHAAPRSTISRRWRRASRRSERRSACWRPASRRWCTAPKTRPRAESANAALFWRECRAWLARGCGGRRRQPAGDRRRCAVDVDRRRASSTASGLGVVDVVARVDRRCRRAKRVGWCSRAACR